MGPVRPAHWWRELAERITKRTGFAVRERDVRKLEYAIDGEMGTYTSSGWGEYLRILDSQSLRSAPWQSVLNRILVGETYMFRHVQQFDFLGDTIPKQKRTLKCWSAGCATGEEAFTMSILFHEHGVRNAEIIGSDISQSALRSAATGRVVARKGVLEDRLDPWIQRGVDDRGNDAWYVTDQVRALIKWEWANLIESDELVARHGPFDVIMCRNVLIYFNDEAVDRALEMFDRALRPDGWLILGHAESLLFRNTSFRMVADGLAYTRRQKKPLAWQVEPKRETPETVRTLRKTSDSPEMVMRRAVALEQDNRTTEAAHVLRKLLSQRDDFLMARLCLSGIYRRTGQVDAARTELTRLARQLSGLPDDFAVPGGDGLTVAALKGFVAPYSGTSGPTAAQ